MAAPAIRLSKKPDGSAVLSCTRVDGSTTWQRHRRHAAFFPLHDLAHVAVETRLGLQSGLFGLLARGGAITDVGSRPIPADAAYEAALAESVVGLLDGERAGERPHSLSEFNQALDISLRHAGQTLARPLSGEDPDAIRSAWQRPVERRGQLPIGGTLDLLSDPSPRLRPTHEDRGRHRLASR